MTRALALLLALVTPGCFTIARWSQDVELTSNVPGARIELADGVWTTPVTAEIERSRKPRMLVATAEGRAPVTFEVVTTEARASTCGSSRARPATCGSSATRRTRVGP